uniref:Uncharacterized protein n=1 Tax=Setaria digitata TaxID=48799 RepID=A0A915Q4Q0_9BILA
MHAESDANEVTADDALAEFGYIGEKQMQMQDDSDNDDDMIGK